MFWVFPLHQQLLQVHVIYLSVPVSLHMEKKLQPTDKGCPRGHIQRNTPTGDRCFSTPPSVSEKPFILPPKFTFHT